MASMKKVGMCEIEYDATVQRGVIRVLMDSDGVPVLSKDGKLSVEVACDAIGIKIGGTDKAELIEQARKIAREKGSVEWSRWLKVEIKKRTHQEEDERDPLSERSASFTIEYIPIERARIGKVDELWKDIKDYERGMEELKRTGRSSRRRYDATLPRGINREALVSGFEKCYYRNSVDRDSMILYVEDTPENRTALGSMISRVVGMYDEVARICGPKGKGATALLTGFLEAERARRIEQAPRVAAPMLLVAPAKRTSSKK